MNTISNLTDVLNQEYFTKLYAEYEKVCQKCLEEVENVKVGTFLKCDSYSVFYQTKY